MALLVLFPNGVVPLYKTNQLTNLEVDKKNCHTQRNVLHGHNKKMPRAVQGVE